MDSDSRGFRRLANGDVQLTMRADDYDRLLLTLGVGIGAGSADIDKAFAFMDRLCAGSPDYIPYDVPKSAS